MFFPPPPAPSPLPFLPLLLAPLLLLLPSLAHASSSSATPANWHRLGLGRTVHVFSPNVSARHRPHDTPDDLIVLTSLAVVARLDPVTSAIRWRILPPIHPPSTPTTPTTTATTATATSNVYPLAAASLHPPAHPSALLLVLLSDQSLCAIDPVAAAVVWHYAPVCSFSVLVPLQQQSTDQHQNVHPVIRLHPCHPPPRPPPPTNHTTTASHQAPSRNTYSTNIHNDPRDNNATRKRHHPRNHTTANSNVDTGANSDTQFISDDDDHDDDDHVIYLNPTTGIPFPAPSIAQLNLPLLSDPSSDIDVQSKHTHSEHPRHHHNSDDPDSDEHPNNEQQQQPPYATKYFDLPAIRNLHLSWPFPPYTVVSHADGALALCNTFNRDDSTCDSQVWGREDGIAHVSSAAIFPFHSPASPLVVVLSTLSTLFAISDARFHHQTNPDITPVPGDNTVVRWKVDVDQSCFLLPALRDHAIVVCATCDSDCEAADAGDDPHGHEQRTTTVRAIRVTDGMVTFQQTKRGFGASRAALEPCRCDLCVIATDASAQTEHLFTSCGTSSLSAFESTTMTVSNTDTTTTTTTASDSSTSTGDPFTTTTTTTTTAMDSTDTGTLDTTTSSSSTTNAQSSSSSSPSSSSSSPSSSLPISSSAGFGWLVYSVGGKELRGVRNGVTTWRLRMPNDATISTLASYSYPMSSSSTSTTSILRRPAPVRVTSARELLRKYVDEDTILVLAHDKTKAELHALIVDAATGALYDARVHAVANPPVAAVRGDHWFVYAFWNSAMLQHELQVVDMYDDSPSNDVSSWVGHTVRAAVRALLGREIMSALGIPDPDFTVACRRPRPPPASDADSDQTQKSTTTTRTTTRTAENEQTSTSSINQSTSTTSSGHSQPAAGVGAGAGDPDTVDSGSSRTISVSDCSDTGHPCVTTEYAVDSSDEDMMQCATTSEGDAHWQQQDGRYSDYEQFMDIVARRHASLSQQYPSQSSSSSSSSSSSYSSTSPSSSSSSSSSSLFSFPWFFSSSSSSSSSTTTSSSTSSSASTSSASSSSSSSSPYTFRAFRRRPKFIRSSMLLTNRITRLDVTQTSMGITQPAVIMTLENGQVTLVPKFILDARSPAARSPAAADSKLKPYEPVLFLESAAGRSIYVAEGAHVPGIKQIIVAPSNVRESSTLLAVLGIDIVFSVVQPVGSFDALVNDEFVYSGVVAMIVGLSASVLYTNRLKLRLSLKKSW